MNALHLKQVNFSRSHANARTQRSRGMMDHFNANRMTLTAALGINPLGVTYNATHQIAPRPRQSQPGAKGFTAEERTPRLVAAWLTDGTCQWEANDSAH